MVIHNLTINLTKLNEACERGHSAFFTTQAGDTIVSLVEFIKEAPDQYGKISGVCLSGRKDSDDSNVNSHVFGSPTKNQVGSGTNYKLNKSLSLQSINNQ
jgi:hypothetical protein